MAAGEKDPYFLGCGYLAQYASMGSFRMAIITPTKYLGDYSRCYRVSGFTRQLFAHFSNYNGVVEGF